jgi:glycosyltransferase involved in cell wall biosynthesis
VLVVASRFDASPHIVAEALQLGVPVIGSDVCGIPEAVRTPLGGQIVRAGNEEALLGAMRAMLRQDPASQRANALVAYAAMGGWPAVAARVVDGMRANGAL